MRVYEELFIVRPETGEEEIDAFIEQIQTVISSAGGTVDKTDKWGVRKLAYKVEKKSEGFYVLIQFTAGPQVVKEVERRMRVTDFVMKFISVRIDEKLKKIEKRRKQREKRAKRKPAPTLAAPSAPAIPAGPGAPGGPTPGAPAPAHPAPETPAETVVAAAPAGETQES